jgi:hypothetical protein
LNILVLGMHRSGTSAVAEALRAAGFEAGPDTALWDPQPQNPMGFGERRDITLFNDRLLASLGWFWDAPDPSPPADPPTRPSFVAEGRVLIESNLAGPRPFMLKDPRMTLLLPWWREILLDRFVPVVVLRQPTEVAWSLKMRDGFPTELGLALWAAYHRHLAAGLDGMQWIGVDYGLLCDEPQATFGRLLESVGALGVKADVDGRAGSLVIRSELRRTTQPKELRTDKNVVAALEEIRRQWAQEAVSVHGADALAVTPPSDWERAILAVHHQTRQAMAREDDVRRDLDRLSSRLATLSTQHAELEGEAADLRTQSESLRRQSDIAAGERNQARAALGELESHFAALSKEHADLDHGVTALVRRVDDITRDRDSARYSVTKLEWQLEQQVGQAALLRREITLAERDRNAAQERLTELEAQAETLRQQVETAESELASVRNASSELEDQLAGRKAPPRPGLPRGSADVRPFVRSLRDGFRRVVVHLPQTLIGLLWHNPLFDESWYLEQYPDVREKGLRPEYHYRRHGVREGRNPSRFFDTRWYLEQNRDVGDRGLNPLDHYLLFGSAEGRNPSSRFDGAWYLSTNPDVTASGSNPLLHYLRHGMAEGRRPTPPS